MKKLIIITAILLLVGSLCSTTEAATKKKTAKKSTTASKSTTPAATYALFTNALPLTGVVPTVESFGFKKSDKVKSLKESVDDENSIGFADYTLVFDENGRLILREVDEYDAYAPSRYKLTYDDQGNLSTLTAISQPAVTDNFYTPLVQRDYVYTWTDGKVSEISETITIDQGVNYKGDPTHLDFNYDDNGILVSAICRENPKVFFKCNIKGKIIETGGYDCGYKKPAHSGPSAPKLDNLFSIVNNKQAALEWDYLSYPVFRDEYEETNYPNILFFTNPVVDEVEFEYDSKGNWIKAIEDYYGGQTIYNREINYYN